MRIFFNMDGIHLSRRVRSDVRNTVFRAIAHGSLESLHKIKIGNHSAHDRDYSVYCMWKDVDGKEFVDLPKDTNYLAGKITKKLTYWVNIGELVWVSDHFRIMPEVKEKIVVTIKKRKA